MSFTFVFSRWTYSLTLAAALLALASPAAADRRLSLDQAVKLALKQSPQIRLEQAKVDETDATRKSTRAHYLPQLKADANALLWDSALAFTLSTPDVSNINDLVTKFGLTPAELLAVAQNQDLLSAMFKFFDLGNVRDQFTANVTINLVQPLTPLLSIHQGYRATQHMADAARLDMEGKRVDLAYQVTRTYLQLMLANAYVEVADTGVEQVEAHLKQARQFRRAGLIGKQEVLKAQLELARAKERVIQARYGGNLASAGLAVLIGLPASERIVPTEKVVDPPPAPSGDLDGTLDKALKARPELKAMERKHRAAVAGKESKKWSMLPQISAMASYQYNYGQATFMPENAFIVGGVLQWDIWDWGNKYYGMKAAGAKAAQAAAGKRLLRDGIEIEVRKAFLGLEQARESLEVARIAITEAEENFRIETKRFEAQSATTTDVLDAQLALTRAKLAYSTQLFNYYVALAGLKKAMGRI
jgi:outer membrane protein TolC